MSASPADQGWVVETTPADFERDVFQASHARPVVVDFWAPWCGPCRMLGPVLEKLAAEFAGQFVLVKANTDENQEAAARFGVQGIPAVYAVIDGEIMDFFSGALPEPQVRSWLDRLAASGRLKALRQLEEEDPSAAEQAYRELLSESPNTSEAQVGLARALFRQGKHDQCRSYLAELSERGFLEPELEKLKAELELEAISGEDLEKRQREAEANPDNLEAQFALAEALAGNRDYEAALKTCLEIVQRDKSGVGQQARELMVDIFRVLPDDSELTREYRRKLSVALY